MQMRSFFGGFTRVFSEIAALNGMSPWGVPGLLGQEGRQDRKWKLNVRVSQMFGSPKFGEIATLVNMSNLQARI